MLYNQLKIRVFVSLLHENEPDIVTEGAGTLPFCTAIDLQEPRMDKKDRAFWASSSHQSFLPHGWKRCILRVVICNVTSGSHQIRQLNSYPEHKSTHAESCQCQKPLAVTLKAARHSDRCRWLLFQAKTTSIYNCDRGFHKVETGHDHFAVATKLEEHDCLKYHLTASCKDLLSAPDQDKH